jgi:hypothetical protein
MIRGQQNIKHTLYLTGFHMYAVYLQQCIFVCMNTKAIEQRKTTEELFSTQAYTFRLLVRLSPRSQRV